MADDHITLPRATVYQVLEALSLCAAGRKLGAVDLNNLIDRIVDATGAQAEPCDMGQLCLNCQPRGLNGECPDKQAKQTKALTDEQKQAIHNVTGASLALICLVENYINGIKEKK